MDTGDNNKGKIFSLTSYYLYGKISIVSSIFTFKEYCKLSCQRSC